MKFSTDKFIYRSLLILALSATTIQAQEDAGPSFKKQADSFKKQSDGPGGFKKSIESGFKKMSDMLNFKKQSNFKKQASDFKKQAGDFKKQADQFKKQADIKKQAQKKQAFPQFKKQIDAGSLKKQNDFFKKQATKKQGFQNLKKQNDFFKKQATKKQGLVKKQVGPGLKKQLGGLKKQNMLLKKSPILKKSFGPGNFKKGTLKKGNLRKFGVGKKKFGGNKKKSSQDKLEQIRKSLFEYTGDSWGSLSDFQDDSWETDEESDLEGLNMDSLIDSALDSEEFDSPISDELTDLENAILDKDDVAIFQATLNRLAREKGIDLEASDDFESPIYSDEGGDDVSIFQRSGPSDNEGMRDLLFSDSEDNGESSEGDYNYAIGPDGRSIAIPPGYTAKEWLKELAEREIAKKKEMEDRQWLTIEKITEGIDGRNNRAFIYTFFMKGYADLHFDANLFRQNLLDMTNEEQNRRAMEGKRWQMAILSTFLIKSKSPRKTDEEWLIDAMELEGYGCHCSPDKENTFPEYLASHDFITGTKGEPLDPIDSVCRARNSCYRCIAMEHQNCHYTQSYDYTINRPGGSSKGKGEYYFECNDPPGSCERALCDCDREYFYSRRDTRDMYNSALSVRNGFTLEFGSCEPKNRNVQGKYDTCCGPAGQRKPISVSTGHMCCGEELFYNDMTMDCCVDDQGFGNLSYQVADKGQCDAIGTL